MFALVQFLCLCLGSCLHICLCLFLLSVAVYTIVSLIYVLSYFSNITASEAQMDYE